MKSQLAKRLLLLGSVLFFGLVVLELAVRLIEPRNVLRSAFTTSDPILNHKFIPGARGRFKTTEFNTEYVINSLGLRDREISRVIDTVREKYGPDALGRGGARER